MTSLQMSVIIPSHNRRETLAMVLDGLSRQTVPLDKFEIIVVLDGPTDDSPALLRQWQQQHPLPYLRWKSQPQSGQAAARNAGVEMAEAPIIVFLDDDIVPEAENLAEHIRWYQDDNHITVLGDCHVVREEPVSFYQLMVWAWWEDMYYERARLDHQTNYRDFCAGNVSLRRADFLAAGGFDMRFRGYGGEDYDLGYRLLNMGVRFIAHPGARSLHYHRTTVDGVLRATRQEARADVLLGRKYPELRSGLRLAQLPNGGFRRLANLALDNPIQGDLVMRLRLRILPLYERAKLRRRWRRVLGQLRVYAYWRGVRDAVGSRTAWAEFASGGTRPAIQRLDIRNGLPDLLPVSQTSVSNLLLVTWGDIQLGSIELPETTGEPLRSYVARQITEQFTNQLAVLIATSAPSYQFLPFSFERTNPDLVVTRAGFNHLTADEHGDQRTLAHLSD
jgi:GT2 family glycosyltransferase